MKWILMLLGWIEWIFSPRLPDVQDLSDEDVAVLEERLRDLGHMI